MDKDDFGVITLGERELYDGRKGKRLLFSAPIQSPLPNCPHCGNNRKVFRGGDKFVCSEFHIITTDDDNEK